MPSSRIAMNRSEHPRRFLRDRGRRSSFHSDRQRKAAGILAPVALRNQAAREHNPRQTRTHELRERERGCRWMRGAAKADGNRSLQREAWRRPRAWERVFLVAAIETLARRAWKLPARKEDLGWRSWASAERSGRSSCGYATLSLGDRRRWELAFPSEPRGSLEDVLTSLDPADEIRSWSRGTFLIRR